MSFYFEDDCQVIEQLERRHGVALEELSDAALRPLFSVYGAATSFEWARFERNRGQGKPFSRARRLDLLRALARGARANQSGPPLFGIFEAETNGASK